jgi:hypothetical protein
MDSGWNIKHIVRLIVTSKTYQQSSDATAATYERDPGNKLLARGPRFRLDAELIRDSALEASGILNPAVGGPSVFPIQPPNVWANPISGEDWTESAGADRFRRGLYTFVKRSAPYPNFLSFDSTSRESCVVRRIRTNTPLQALAQMNDQMNMEASLGLAARMKKEGGKDPLSYGFRLCTCRRPNADEAKRLHALYDKLLERYRSNPEQSAKLGKNPEDAALVLTANTLLNLDETVTRR